LATEVAEFSESAERREKREEKFSFVSLFLSALSEPSVNSVAKS